MTNISGNDSKDGVVECGQAEVVELQNALEAKIKELERQSNQKISEIKTVANKKVSDLKKKGDLRPQDVAKIEAAAYADIQELVRVTFKESDLIAGDHIKEMAGLCEKHNLPLPEAKMIDVCLQSSKDLEPKKTTKDKEAKGKDKRMSIEDKLSYLVFFLITPVGMVVIEDYFAVGMLLIVGGSLHLPMISRFLLTKYSWLRALNLILISNTLIVGGFVELIYFSSIA